MQVQKLAEQLLKERFRSGGGAAPLGDTPEASAGGGGGGAPSESLPAGPASPPAKRPVGRPRKDRKIEVHTSDEGDAALLVGLAGSSPLVSVGTVDGKVQLPFGCIETMIDL